MIEVAELTRRFGSGPESVLAVDHLSFRVGAGEVYGLLGPNGAGKTTTLRMILGLLAPSSGEVVAAGHRVSTNPEAVKRSIGLVSASAGLYPYLTTRETLWFFADLYDLPRAATGERIGQLADVLGLEPFLDRRCGVLSTGQKQRVTLARALIHDPPIMLLDEPTRGLDVVGTHVIFEYIRHLRELGKAVVLCTHRLDEASGVCDRMGLLQHGRMRHEGTFAELQAATGCSTLYEMFLLLMGRPPLHEVMAEESP